LLKSVPVDKVKEFEKKFLELMNLKYRKTLDSIKEGKLTDDVITALEKVGAEISSSYE
jgi:F-type H+-transporting ATPase subunit alpha